MTFRRATLDDLEAVLSVIARADEEGGDWAPEDGSDADRRRVTELLAAPGHYNEVAEAAGGRVVGYVNINDRQGAAHLSYLFVDPDHQGRGIGTALMQRALDDARRRGHVRATLATAIQNPARAFYEHAGWQDTGVRLRHEALGLDMVHYALDLRAS
ncbi:MAG: [ribosomal protein S18]-alanine N-acetyltransferase [Thermoleophilaceae bacterium]|nr:[ribosomal protein S18]-alanine N-acetyltransferase [Thermoleophilaceae bacterium]